MTRYEQVTSTLHRMHEATDRIARSKRNRAFAMGRPFGLVDMCCIHNASISDVGRGWGAGPDGRETIRTAKAIKRLLEQPTGTEISDRYYARVCQEGL